MMGPSSEQRGRVVPGGPLLRRLRALLVVRNLGPELISAASDSDPTNVGVAASVGAQTGYQLAWVALLVAPLLGVVQLIAAQVAAVAHEDMQSLTVKRYGRRVAVCFMVSVVVVNVVTIAADLQAGAAGLGLLLNVDAHWLVVPFGLLLGALLLVGTYQHAASVVRYLLLGFLAFGAAAVLAHPSWPHVLRGSLVPSLSSGRLALSGTLALLGTTLTSYVYVWETVGRGVEEPPEPGPRALKRIKAGAVAGAIFTALILWLMLVASAATLGGRHLTVSSAADAAYALRPLAGAGATDLFAIGLVASALVALPVLMLTSAYVVGAHFGWRRGLSEGVSSAPGFYAALITTLGLALGLTLAQVPVVSMLVLASVLGGLGTPLGLVLLVRLARDPVVMGAEPISRNLAAAGWSVAIVVGGFGVLFVIGQLLGWL